MPSLDRLVSEFVDQNNLRFEGDSGVESFEKLVEAMGYKAHAFRFGQLAEVFLSDNPGAIEALVEWISKQRIQEWANNLQSHLSELDDDEDDEDNEPTQILIDNGGIFDGTIEQFRNCFFSNATIPLIAKWAKDNNFKVEFKYE